MLGKVQLTLPFINLLLNSLTPSQEEEYRELFVHTAPLVDLGLLKSVGYVQDIEVTFN